MPNTRGERRLAIIDLGSNSCRLVIFAQSAGNAYRLVDQVSERVRIGEGMFGTNRLQAEPMTRTLRLLKLFSELCRANAIDHIIAVATSAVRDAVNREEFLNRVRQETGLKFRVLSGEEEAYYSYLGVINSVILKDGVIADLGGGSLELVRVRERLPVEMVSLPLGTVRLTEQFLHHDPIQRREACTLLGYIAGQLDALGWTPAGAADQLVVLGGTMRSLADMDQSRRDYPLNREHGYVMTERALHDWVTELFERSYEERKKIIGRDKDRADVIPAGAAVIWQLMRYLDLKSVLVSGRGLREGLFYAEWLGQASRHHRKGVSPGVSYAAPSPQFRAASGISRVPLVADVRALGVANVGEMYGIDWAHAEHVCDLALAIFDQLRPLHHLGPAERALLGYAALLHDVGVTINYYRHDRHSAYLIENAELPGFTHPEIALMAMLGRWHRRGQPDLKPYRQLFNARDEDRMWKLAAVLRLAENLERSRAQVVREVRCRVRARRIDIQVVTRGSAEPEVWAANRDSDIFATAFDRPIKVTAVRGSPRRLRHGPHRLLKALERAAHLAAKLKPGR